ncbi:MAG: ribonuclease R [Gammaproteobacteria bacterium]|nr:ribonuclease R [Gammaproteobacteria bacterium]
MPKLPADPKKNKTKHKSTRKRANKKPAFKNTKKDPYFAREALTYEHPVPSREFIQEYLREFNKPATFEQLLKAFDLKIEDERIGLERRLGAMLRDGQLVLNRGDCYGLIDRMSLVAGFVQAHRDGFGWLIPDAGGADVFLHARQMQQVFNNDRVLVRVISKEGRKPEGAIVEILERNTQQVAGRFFQENGVSFVDPDSKAIVQEIIIPKGAEGAAVHGQFVVVNITSQPTSRRQPIGEVVEILGDQLTPGMEVELAIRAHSLPFKFPSDVTSEAATLPSAVLPDDIKNRRDLRQLPFVTIDGEDAKDFDDAVYCEPLKNGGWRAFIAIADVAHYVTPDSALDKEAQIRGNSVYFPSRVIPMLPEKLSNELCSLRPNCDRLTLVCEIELNKDADVTSYRFDNAVIHSQARLTYTAVADILSNDASGDKGINPHLKNLHQLFKKLILQRQLRGAIEFETTETQIIFGDDGKIDRIVPRKRNVAHRIIEEMMLLANEVTSQYLEKTGIPILYRVHDLPEPEKLANLRDFLKAFSLKLTGGDRPAPVDFAKLLERVSKRPDANLIQTVMLRSLKQAIYSTDNRGHFGLSYDSYTHFTSPIRRYPDLMIHRALKQAILKQKKSQFLYNAEKVEMVGEHCSMTERRADRASRDATDWLKCDYLKNKAGQTFDGVIADVTGFGLFVELKDIFVQGLVHITALKNDYYQFDSVHHLLRGKAGNLTYRLGDSIRVQIARVDLDQRKIDFILG